MAIDHSDRIFLVGESFTGGRVAAAAGFNPDGTLGQTFGSAGIMTKKLVNTNWRAFLLIASRIAGLCQLETGTISFEGTHLHKIGVPSAALCDSANPAFSRAQPALRRPTNRSQVRRFRAMNAGQALGQFWNQKGDLIKSSSYTACKSI
jgi:hypothetical protein